VVFAHAAGSTVVQTTTTTATGVGALYKSADGGKTWTTTNVGAGLPAGIVAMDVSPMYATDTTILAATATALYRSRDGGQDFLSVITAPVTLTGTIKSIDIAPYYVSSGGTAMLIATTNMIALYSDDLGWRNITTATFTVGPTTGQPTNFAPGNILVAHFSPTYQTDGEILAVVSGPVVAPMTSAGTVLETLFANSAWNATVQPSNLTVNATPANFVDLSATAVASLAFPSDYNSSSSTLNRVFVSVGDPLGTATSPTVGFDVWRVNGSVNSGGTVTNATQMRLTDATSPANNTSLAYTGTTATGTLVVGEYGTGGVWYDSSPNSTGGWIQSSSGFVPGNNVGQNVRVQFPMSTGANPTTLYAATDNRAVSPTLNWGSAFFSSTDYNSFKAMSLISVPNLNIISLSQPSGPIKGTTDQYLMMTANQGAPTVVTLGDIQMIFKSTDSGATWAEVFGMADNIPGPGTPPSNATPPVGQVAGQALNNIFTTSTYATDKTVYIPMTANTIWKTTDGGNTWSSIISTTPNNSISAFGLIDANTYWLGSNQGGIYKSGSYTQIATLDGTVPFQIFVLPIGLIINTWTGEVYLSSDQGATFTRLGNANQFSNGSTVGPGPNQTFFNDRASLAFDVPNKTIYAANSTNTISSTIYKWTIGTDTSWVNWCTVAYVPIGTAAPLPAPTGVNISSLILAGDGTLYVRIPNNLPFAPTGSIYNSQLLRSVNLTAPQGQQTFSGIPGTDSTTNGFGNTGGGNLPGGKSTWIVTDATAQTNTIFQIVSGVATTQTGYPVVIKSYVDTLTGMPVTTAPKNADNIPNPYTFTWNAVTSPQQVTYQVQIATDSGFNGLITLPAGGPNNVAGQTTATSMFVNTVGGSPVLNPGTSYFFRVSTVLPLPSKWSNTVAFTVKLGTTGSDITGLNGNRISPAAGASGVPLTPSFQWASVSGADSYHIQVADNPGFTTPLADASTKDTFYTMTTALKPGTTYYWRIQSVSGTNASDYVSNVFTTANAGSPGGTGGTGSTTTVAPAPAITPTIIVTIPAPAPAAPPATPAYIWVIIAIGAVLVIAVIVLIARTRRV
jgi:photosystem II stability/assembly factor-like uncharacterized protein